MRRQNERENKALVKDRYAEVAAINTTRGHLMTYIKNLGGRVANYETSTIDICKDKGTKSNDSEARQSLNTSLGVKLGHKIFVEEKLQGMMAQAENLLRRCTTHGASSATVTENPKKMNKTPARLPGPPKLKHNMEANSSIPTSRDNKSVSITGFGSSRVRPDDDTSFCTCVLS